MLDLTSPAFVERCQHTLLLGHAPAQAAKPPESVKRQFKKRVEHCSGSR